MRNLLPLVLAAGVLSGCANLPPEFCEPPAPPPGPGPGPVPDCCDGPDREEPDRPERDIVRP